jgi:hypothetical protein
VGSTDVTGTTGPNGIRWSCDSEGVCDGVPDWYYAQPQEELAKTGLFDSNSTGWLAFTGLAFLLGGWVLRTWVDRRRAHD